MEENALILVIDDSQTTLMLMEWALQENGYKTHVAIDIKEAENFLTTNKPRVILLDLSLPEVSGFDFLKTIKADITNKDIPIIVISAFDNHETIQEVKMLGALDFVPKPVNLKLLMQKIKDVISRS
jgi:two-component system sensor histidine kinase/response regulator